MWSGSTDILTNHSPRNFMYNNKVFLLDEITDENCAYLIADLTTYIMSEENHGRPLTFIINSVGGNVNTMMTIIGLINIAKLSDIPVITFVLGLAASAASMIAVQGDERYINKISRHFIHFGCIWDITTKHTEIEKMYLQNKQYSESMIDLYLEACGGKLSREKLLSLQSDERGYLNAEECVKYGLCDAIIEDDLDIRKKEQEELDKHYGEFEEYMKQKAKQEKLAKKETKKKVNNKISKKKA